MTCFFKNMGFHKRKSQSKPKIKIKRIFAEKIIFPNIEKIMGVHVFGRPVGQIEKQER